MLSRATRTQFIAVASACFLTMASACTSSKPTAKQTDSVSATTSQVAAERDSVRAFLSDFTGKMNSGDFEGLGKLYSEDSLFYWIESGALVARNAKEIRESLQQLKNIPQIRLSYYETHIDITAPGVAEVRTEFSQALLDKKGQGSTYGGYLTMTIVHEKDGWRLRNGHTSSRKPRPGI